MSTCEKNKEPIVLTNDIEKSQDLWRMMMTYDGDVWFWAAGSDIYKQQQYDHDEKSTKFFLNLEKHRAIESQIRYVIINQDEITDQDEIIKEIISFYQSLFSRKVQLHTDKIDPYLENIPLPKLTIEQKSICEGTISEDKVFKSSKSMENNKSPGNDGLSKKFY